MRVCIVGHSLIHPRQYLFVEELRRQEIEVLEIFPEKWNHQRRDGGYEIEAGGVADFKFLDSTYRDVYNFKPDIIYSMTEWWQVQAWRCRRWAKSLSAKLVYFFWENLRQPDERQQDLIRSADLIVCGNEEGAAIVAPFAQRIAVMPQVGIDTSMFRPIDIPIKQDIIFVGRHVPEKGIEYIEHLKKNGYNVYTPFNMAYEGMVGCYNSAKVQVVPSLDTPTWKEQGPMCIAESLACNVPVVAFTSGSILSNYNSCGHVIQATPHLQGLINGIDWVLKNNFTGGRDWVMENMSNEIIAKKLIAEFEEL